MPIAHGRTSVEPMSVRGRGDQLKCQVSMVLLTFKGFP